MNPKKILIIGPSWLGDMVIAQKLFKVIKDIYPDSELHVASPAWTMPLVTRMPEVSKSISLPFSHGELNILKRYQIAKTLKLEGYSQAIVLPNSFKSALIPFFAGISKRTGFLGEVRFALINDRIKKDPLLYRTVDQFLALAPKSKSTKVSLSTYLISKPSQGKKLLPGKLSGSDKVLGIAPGAEYGESKRWPIEYFADVANEAIQKGWVVISLGSTHDQDLGKTLDRLTKNKVINLIGKTKLEEVIDVMSLCQKFLSNDSGLMHVAASLNIKQVAIFGSSDPKKTPPLSRHAKLAYLDLSCSPCFERICPLQHTNCLKNIKPSEIIKKLI
ncbi:lipopolysaccharide heptosyltransferase II [Candidatus Methylopumilus universalis]|uniref:lipopolysaccharide heptosyltransferase II n=1 Tax=Candidatus Methylopumilus TaxID=1679002 RepID=UPI001120AD22|nr:lipopolysaccharide heptosyltransferase II [Candidatus Methylopumilus universalis]QDC47654.1 lipopolysaccharide heptosyltransferase II [Candidatus Methylopumilus universalis]QDC72181.1 lipopolysaccharide heptosyltransferase II [Candidatus Methylopumilus universalis]